jgi:putative Holliday junction resolvase
MDNNILALDIGEKRIGVARANTIAKIPEPIATINNNKDFGENFNELVKEYHPKTIIVGLPRNLSGQETAQSKYTRDFVSSNLSKYNVFWQDETLSTNQASLQSVGKHGIDADAACVILEDYFKENNGV